MSCRFGFASWVPQIRNLISRTPHFRHYISSEEYFPVYIVGFNEHFLLYMVQVEENFSSHILRIGERIPLITGRSEEYYLNEV